MPVTDHYDIIIIGSGAGGGTLAQALARHRRAHPDPRARRLRPAGRRELESGSGLEASALPDRRALARRARPRVPALHALLRRRQHEVLGQRPVPAARARISRRSSTPTASRRPGRSTYETLEPYYDRAERLYHVRGQHGVDPTEVPRGPYPVCSRFRTRTRWRHIVDQLRALGLHPSPLPLGLLRPGESDGCVLCNTCNSFPCKVHAKSDAEVCCVRHATPQPNVTLWTNAHARRLITDARGAKVEAVEVERERRDRSRRRARRDRLVRRGELRRAAAAVGERRASRRPREFVGARRPALHGAPCDDDAGVSSVSAERDGVSEDGGDQRFLPARADTTLPARPDPVAGTDARRHGADRRAVDPAVGATKRGWRAAWTGSPSRKICRATDNRVTVDAGRPHPPAAPAEQPARRTSGSSPK